jgi:hypothetical protein
MFAGCGGGDGEAESATTPEAAVQLYFQAISAADGNTACGLLTDSLLEGDAITGAPAGGEDCVADVDARAPTEQSELRTEVLEESDTSATVKVVVEGNTPLAVQLEKEGESWKIASWAISAAQ